MKLRNGKARMAEWSMERISYSLEVENLLYKQMEIIEGLVTSVITFWTFHFDEWFGFFSIVLWFQWFLCFCGRRLWRVIYLFRFHCVVSIVSNNFVSETLLSSSIIHEKWKLVSQIYPWANSTRSISNKFYLSWCSGSTISEQREKKWKWEREEVRASGSVDGGCLMFIVTICFFISLSGLQRPRRI